jgi:rhamnosyltransferase
MKIGCVIVLYYPNPLLFEMVFNSVIGQVDHIFISDNSPETTDLPFLNKLSDLTYQKMAGNIGIAAAQNVGIRYFLENDFSHVIFLDQDSIMEPGLVNQLSDDLIFLQKQGILVGGVGPRPVNRISEKEYRGTIKKGIPYNEALTEVTALISSAFMIPLNYMEKVGLLDESLFIDGVDHEWCWRATSSDKLRFFISEKTHLNHSEGEGDKLFIVRKVIIPTPFRTYYQFRNYFILCKRNYVPIYWKTSNAIKYLFKFFYFPLFLNDFKGYWGNITRGIRDGLFYKK